MEKAIFHEQIKLTKSISDTAKATYPALVISFLGFFTGRVCLFQFMSPLCIAYLANFVGFNNKIYILAMAIMAGIMTKFSGLLLLKTLSSVIITCAGHMFSQMAGTSLKGARAYVLAGFAVLFSGLLFTFLYDQSLYYALMSVAECIFAITLSVLMKDGASILSGRLKENIIDTESLISLIIIFGAVVAGASDIYIGPLSLKYCLCIFITLSGAKRGGAPIGAMTGVVLGFILTLVGYFNYSLIGVLSVSGIVCGFFRKSGKPITILSFLAGSVLSALYLDTALLNVELLYASICAILLFVITPDNFTIGLNTLTVSKAVSEATQTKALTKQKITDLAEIFAQMARIFLSISEKQSTLTQKDISNIIDNAAAKACTECPNNSNCWEKNFCQSYQMSFAMLEVYEQEGLITPQALPDEYSEHCKYMGYYSSWLSRLMDINKLNLSWQNQLAESRDLISQQLSGVAASLFNLSEEINQKEIFREDLAEKIIFAFTQKGIEVRNVIVVENTYGKYSVTMERKGCAAKKGCIREMAKIISAALSRKMRAGSKVCIADRIQARCSISFMEEARFNVVSGAAAAKKENSASSGDCHSTMEIKDGQIILALSDAMGSGAKARAESEAAMSLLESFIVAGFSKELALRLINSALVLKSGEESFSTMDICSIDLHSGQAEFIKIGAATTYIKRGKGVAQIISESLPMGILNDVDLEASHKKLKNGDFLIMVTDGVTDAGEAGLERSWVASALEEFDGTNPQDMADYLLELAIKRSDEHIRDDMTVLCARVWEKHK